MAPMRHLPANWQAILEKTFQNRFLKWFENYDSYDISDEEKDILKKMNIAINDQKDKILAELQEKYSQKDSEG